MRSEFCIVQFRKHRDLGKDKTSFFFFLSNLESIFSDLMVYYCFTFRCIPGIYLHNCCDQVVYISKSILEFLGLDVLGFLANGKGR